MVSMSGAFIKKESYKNLTQFLKHLNDPLKSFSEMIDNQSAQTEQLLKDVEEFRMNLDYLVDMRIIRVAELSLKDETALQRNFFHDIDDATIKSREIVGLQHVSIQLAIHERIEMHKSQGDKYLQRLIEWQNVVKDQFQRLRVLKPEDYKDKAYQEYRSVGRLIDELALYAIGVLRIVTYCFHKYEIVDKEIQEIEKILSTVQSKCKENNSQPHSELPIATQVITKILSAEILRQFSQHHCVIARNTTVGSLTRRLLHYNESKRYYIKSLSLYPTLAACWSITECDLISRAYRGLQQFDVAAKVINKALSLDPLPIVSLSIDGGGIRGIIPVVVLSEVELCTHRPISHIFNLISATSTGDIIAPGLTIPKCRWNCNPKYQAADILSLYRDELHDIFRKRPALHILFNFKSHNYSGTRLKDKFDSYFGDIKLSEPLVDIDQEYGNEAYEYDAKPSKVFIDGKVHANNPAGYCYKYALDQGIKKENIYMSSLGTGDCVDGILWPKKTPSINFLIKAGQELIEDLRSDDNNS
ncbi:Patatin-like protein 5 [Trichoplax sp. H2]|nr:Patatin-like protein 5 [Trichoplax sp. H2]|eukprot:RDD38736.1 Patatin-like protein 5 [Trichoplax sp. H2]